MYVNKFVTVIRVNEKILKETNGEVKLPFGSEYSILLKNLNSVRAFASISIDGKDITDGTRFILDANSTFEIERFLANGNFNQGNKLKFIERSATVEAHRGIGSDDGLVRVEFWKEEVPIKIPTPRYEYYSVPTYQPSFIPWDRRRRKSTDNWRERRIGGSASRNLMKSASNTSGESIFSSCNKGTTEVFMSSSLSSLNNLNYTQLNNLNYTQETETGITAPGSISNQQFHYGSTFPIETQSTVIVLHLKGQLKGKAVTVPVITKRKVKCISCGLANKQNSQFCSRCGTGLELVG